MSRRREFQIVTYKFAISPVYNFYSGGFTLLNIIVESWEIKKFSGIEVIRVINVRSFKAKVRFIYRLIDLSGILNLRRLPIKSP